MSLKRIIKSDRGFSLLMVLGLVVIMAVTALTLQAAITQAKKEAFLIRVNGARDRIWANVHSVALMPAALRNSARATAANEISPQNPELRNCLNGTQPNGCRTGTEYPLSLFMPIMLRDAAGVPTGLQRVSMGIGSVEQFRLNLNGTACLEARSDCFFVVTSSFVPTCGPPPRPLVMPANPLSPNIFAPTSQCTVAETVEVRFTIDIDPSPALRDRYPYLAAVAPKTGLAIQNVKDISGNDPQ